MVELVDTQVLGTCALRREGSSPFIRTQKTRSLRDRVFYFLHPVSPHRDIQAPILGCLFQYSHLLARAACTYHKPLRQSTVIPLKGPVLM